MADQFNLKSEKDEREWKNWDGYIDPQGNFYQTKPIGMDYWCGSFNAHEEWADQYSEENDIDYLLGEDSRDTAKDYLIEVLGWASFGSSFGFDTPELCLPKKLTKPQEDTLFKLYQIKKLDMKNYYKNIGFEGGI